MHTGVPTSKQRRRAAPIRIKPQVRQPRRPVQHHVPTIQKKSQHTVLIFCVRLSVFFFGVLFLVDWGAGILYRWLLPYTESYTGYFLLGYYIVLGAMWLATWGRPKNMLRRPYESVIHIVASVVKSLHKKLRKHGIWTALGGQVLLLILGLYVFNALNLLRAPFNVLADPFLIAINPAIERIHPAWARMYNYCVDTGMRWQPAYLRSGDQWHTSIQVQGSNQTIYKRMAFFAPYWHNVAQQYNIPSSILFGINGQETAGLFGRLPECSQKHDSNGKAHTMTCAGGTELGLTHIQAARCHENWLPKEILDWLTLNFFIVSNRRHDYMEKSRVYNDRLEFQRAKILIFFCGISLPDWADYIRYYLLGSIDDRLSSKIFSYTARHVTRDWYEVKKLKPATATRHYKLVVQRWSGHSMQSRAINLYVRKGNGYIAWEKKYKP